MSVFTQVTPAILLPWLENYQVGEFKSLHPIKVGVQNSNFFLETTLGSWVLTLFESLDPAEVQIYLDLMLNLHASGMPVAAPQRQQGGELWSLLADKPTALVERCPGDSLEVADVSSVHRLGECLAKLHGLMRSWPGPENPRGRLWRSSASRQILTGLESRDADLIAWAMQIDRALPWQDLPAGGIHADLFRDNVLWQGGNISAVLDFYVAGRDAWAYDLAICVHDWCRFPGGALDVHRASALLKAYHAVRPLTQVEREVWPSLLVVSALRFYLSRCLASLRRVDNKDILQKDPEEFHLILNCMRTNEWDGSANFIQVLLD